MSGIAPIRLVQGLIISAVRFLLQATVQYLMVSLYLFSQTRRPLSIASFRLYQHLTARRANGDSNPKEFNLSNHLPSERPHRPNTWVSEFHTRIRRIGRTSIVITSGLLSTSAGQYQFRAPVIVCLPYMSFLTQGAHGSPNPLSPIH